MKKSAWKLGLGRVLAAAALVGGAAMASGCVVQTHDTVVGSGDLLVYWTIGHGSDPASCTATNTGYARVDVINTAGVKVNNGSDTQNCGTFSTSFTQGFAAGNYTVQVTMLANDASTPRTTTATAGVYIPGDGSTATVSVDFPLNSFF